jgi:hypothetical protein
MKEESMVCRGNFNPFPSLSLITIDEVYRYVSMRVPQATGQDQHPVKKGEMTGQIVLGVLK